MFFHFMLYDLKIKLLFELYKIYVYCKHFFIFALDLKTGSVENAIEYCNLYSALDGFFLSP